MTFSKSSKPEKAQINGANLISKVYPTDGVVVSVWSNVHGVVQVDIHDQSESGEHCMITATPDPTYAKAGKP